MTVEPPPAATRQPVPPPGPPVTPPVPRELPDPVVRLSRAAFRLSLVAAASAWLPWSLPPGTDGVIATTAPRLPLTVATLSAALVGAAAALFVAASRQATARQLTGLMLLAAGVGGAVVRSVVAQGFATRVGSIVGPATWLYLSLVSGVTLLSLFTGAARYEQWRDERGAAPEHVAARERIAAMLPG